MKKTIGNPLGEAHNKDMVVYEWIAPPGTDPYTVPDKIMAVFPSLKLRAMGGEQNGFVNTSLSPTGALHVQIALHQFECLDDNCNGGEGKMKIRIAPTLSDKDAKDMKLAVGEHANLKVAGDNDAG